MRVACGGGLAEVWARFAQARQLMHRRSKALSAQVVAAADHESGLDGLSGNIGVVSSGTPLKRCRRGRCKGPAAR